MLCFSQCSHNNKSAEYREVEIEIKDYDTCSMDSFDYYITPLEDAPKGLFGSIGRMFATENGYYILNTRETPVLYLFGKDGKFIRVINKQGHSQKEYVRIFNFASNEKGDTIAILDKLGREIKLYDQYGHFLLRHIFDDEYSWDDCAIIDNHFYMVSFHGGNKGIVTRYNNDFSEKEIIGEDTQPLVPGAGVAMTKYIQYNSSMICCLDYFNSCFFLIDRNTNDIIRKYSLHSSNMLSKESVLERILGYDQIISYMLSDDYLYFEMSVKGKTTMFKLNLADDKLYKFDTFVNFLDYKNGLFFSSMPAEYVKICMDQDWYFHRNEKRLKAFSSVKDKLSEQENPFLIINKWSE